MRILVVALAFVLLAGCIARPMNEVRQDGAYKVLHSKKTDKALAECVQYEWQNQSLFGVTPQATMQPVRDGGYTVFTAASEYFVDIKQGATGTDARFYVIAKNWIAKARLEKLQSCL
jgi:major membrane immunogen (membrane-anchored lipoprotein)